MKRIYDPHWFLILTFLGTIVSVPLIQAVIETRRAQQPQALEVFKRKPTAANLRSYERNLEDASWVAKQFRPWAQYVQFAWLRDGGEKALVGHDGWLFYKPGVQYMTERAHTPRINGTSGDAIVAIVDFRDQLAARGIQLLVVPAPDKESIYPERLTWRARNLRGVLCDETRSVLSGLKAAGVDVVDLHELFARAKAPASSTSENALYLAQDSHWSPAGLDLAAKAVARRILERQPLTAGTVDYEDRASSTPRLGDLVQMLQAAPLERHTTPENVPCVQVVRRGLGKLYQDDPNSEILVLGDSFLRIFQTDEPGAAGFIAHLANELKQPLASIVNDGGASTLVRQELYRRPALLANKKLVIWEFVERDIRLGTEGWQGVPLPPVKSATGAARRQNASAGDQAN